MYVKGDQFILNQARTAYNLNKIRDGIILLSFFDQK